MVRPRTHLLLRVRLDGEVWHADVGFGSGTLMAPLPFGPSGTHEQWGWRFRVVPEGSDLVLQTQDEETWRAVYVFPTEPTPPIDIELSNWFTATHPQSRFVTGLIVVRQLPDGTRLSLSDWSGTLTLARRTPADGVASEVSREDVPDLLADQFLLPGFVLDEAGRLVKG